MKKIIPALLLAVVLAAGCARDQGAVQSPTPFPTPTPTSPASSPGRPVPALPPPTVPAPGASIILEPAILTLRAGETREVNVVIKNVAALYGAEVHLTFDPTILSPLDGYVETPGVQLIHGGFLDPAKGFVAQNQADGATGAADYAIVLVPPAAPVSGDGILATLRFRAAREGASTLQIRDSKLANLTDGKVSAIPHSTSGARVEVSQ